MGRRRPSASLLALAAIVPAAVTGFGLLPQYSPFTSPSRTPTTTSAMRESYRHDYQRGYGLGHRRRCRQGYLQGCLGSTNTDRGKSSPGLSSSSSSSNSGAHRSARRWGLSQVRAGAVARAGAGAGVGDVAGVGAGPGRRRPRRLLSPLSASFAPNEEPPPPPSSPPPASSSSPPSPKAELTAEQTAEAALRKLSPSELDGMKPRLGLDRQLEGEAIIAGAIPILAAKIRARASAQEVGRSAAAAAAAATAEDSPGGAGDAAAAAPPMPAAPAQPAQPAKLSSSAVPTPPRSQEDGGVASEGDWAGGDGVERGWVGEKGSRRWVGAPGEKPPRQRHADREPEPPLAPGQRSYFATCPRGLETVLQEELMSPAIGATMVKSSGRGCHFRGDQAVGYKAILWLRTAHRVLELVGEGGAPLGAAIDGADTLYEAAAAVPWSRFMRQGQTLSVDAILGVVPDGLTHSHFTALTVKMLK